MPTKQLPADPNLDHLKHQAKDLFKAHKERNQQAAQRIREFHPRFRRATDEAIFEAGFKLSDARLAIAREYGFPSWMRLKLHVKDENRPDLGLPRQELITDPEFRKAVDLLDAGDVEGLKAHLGEHPEIVRQRVEFDGWNYFQNPCLLEFIAENPVRNGTLPVNIVEIATIILEAGAKQDKDMLIAATGLVASGMVPRKCGVQIPLINLLCKYGTNKNKGLRAGLIHGEFEAVEAFIRNGATIDFIAACGLGRIEEAKNLLEKANPNDRQVGLAIACLFGHFEPVQLLLEAGEDPNKYSPPGFHSHSTPLHQAALAGHLPIVKLLVEHGARTNIKDVLWNGTPLGWAEHGGQTEVAQYLQSLS